jgi:hypothetical protein
MGVAFTVHGETASFPLAAVHSALARLAVSHLLRQVESYGQRTGAAIGKCVNLVQVDFETSRHAVEFKLSWWPSCDAALIDLLIGAT